MMSRFKIFNKTTYLSFILALTACGGGGGSSFSPPDIPNTLIAITADNQYDVVSSGTIGATGVASGTTVAASSGGLIPGGVIASGTTGTSGFNVFDFASGKLISYISLSGASDTTLPAGVTVSDSIPCDSGSISFSVTIADQNSQMLVAGDSVSLSFNSCTSTLDGTTITGSISAKVDSGSLDFNCSSACADVSLSVNFNDVTVHDSSGDATIHGGFTLAKSNTTTSFSGSSLYLIAPTAAVQLTNFNISSDTTTDSTGTLQSTSVNMTIASTLLNGSVNVQTDPNAPVQQYDFEMYPHAGTVTVTGSNNSSLTVDYLANDSVQLTLDADGDGNADAGYPVTVTWTEIETAVATN